MWRLHRYYLKEVLINSAITFLVLFAIVLVSVVYRGIDGSQGGGIVQMVLVILYWALDSFQHLLTISFLLATVMTFTRAAMDRELTAIRAAGISPRVPMTSAVLVGLLLTAVGSFATHYVVPEVHFNKYHVIARVVREAWLSMGLDSDRIKLRDFVMTFGERDGDEFRQCVIYLPKPIGRLNLPIAFVDRVSIPMPSERDAGIPIGIHGLRNPMGDLLPSLDFVIPLSDLSSNRGRDDRDDDLTSDQLLAEVMRGVHPDPVAATYTLLRRCCFAFMPLLLAPIGYCLAELARDRGRVTALLLALVPLSLFYLGEVLGARFLLTTDAPVCALMPAGLLLLFGAPLCWRQLRR